MGTLRRVLLRFLSFFRSGRAEADLSREITAHLQLLEDQFIARGMSATDASRAARRAFGGVEQVKERQRDERSYRWLASSWLDVKLGFRMLIKYPGLTLVGGLGMAVAIAIAAGAFAIIYTLVHPALPLDDGHRIVTIQNWDAAANNPERRVLHDFVTWRDELTSVQDVGAFRQVSRNLIAGGAMPETVRLAEISASAFRVTRIPPLMGRHLVEADERDGAPPVLVIGHDVWRNRFGGDPQIVGAKVQLGDTAHTIVGVMPEGYAFPINNRFWIPFRAEPSRYERLKGPALTVFGRLAPGASLAGADAELGVIGQRAAAASPDTHGRLRPRVLPYTYPFFDIDDPATAWMAHVLQLLITLLLVIVCVNVAILVYARTATRHAEIAVRAALGASRGRILAQLFFEALVLSAVAAIAGLAVASIGLGQVNAAMAQSFPQVPFWWIFGLSPGLVLYVVGLAILAAAIVGVVPALQVTGGGVQTGLRGISAGGGSGMLFGRTWTVLIVLQVAIAVALLPAAVFHAWDSLRHGLVDPDDRAKEFLTLQFVLDRPDAPPVRSEAYDRDFTARYTDRLEDLQRRLEAEPGISDITFSSSVPGGEPTVWIEAEGVAAPEGAGGEGGWVQSGTGAGHQVRFNRIDVDFLETFGVPILTGRGFGPGDVETGNPQLADPRSGEGTILVNESFVENVLGNSQALGRRVRYVGASNDAEPGDVTLGRWYQIVGVVADFPAKLTDNGLAPAKLYHASSAGGTYGGTLSIRLQGRDAAGFAGRLRQISAAIDPNLQLRNVATLDAVLRQDQGMLRVVAAVLAVLTLSVVLLSAAGIYALMSFTVEQRRKEIGIRTALGAEPRQIVGGIFSRALWQLTIGAVLGITVAGLLEGATDGGLMMGNGRLVLPIVAAFMMVVGLLAALGPARRSLRIQPTEALRQS